MPRHQQDSASLIAADKLEAGMAGSGAKRALARTQLADAKRKFTDPGHEHGPSIKCPAIYEALRRKGYSKEKAARISNSRC